MCGDGTNDVKALSSSLQDGVMRARFERKAVTNDADCDFSWTQNGDMRMHFATGVGAITGDNFAPKRSGSAFFDFRDVANAVECANAPWAGSERAETGKFNGHSDVFAVADADADVGVGNGGNENSSRSALAVLLSALVLEIFR